MFKVAVCLIIFSVMIGSAEAMQISFFEEFPDDKTLDKVAQIDFDTRIYVAARSLSEFYDYERDFKSANERVKSVIYWPVLQKQEGYWISPWSDSEALERILGEIKERKDKKELEVLLDLEPSLKRSRLFSFKDFQSNKEHIADFIQNARNYNLTVSTVEKTYVSERLLKYIGLSFDPAEFGNRKIKMYYSSYRRRFLPDFIVDQLYGQKVQEYTEQGVNVGLGLIAPGIHNETHYLSPEILQREIEIASKNGIEEVIIFRLGGLDQEYVKMLEKFKLKN